MSARAINAFKTLGQGEIIEHSKSQDGGPQKTALKIKASNSGILVKLGMFKYAVVTNIPSFLDFVITEPKQDRNWYVVATANDHKKGWIDLEFLVDVNDRYENGELASGASKPLLLAKYFATFYIDVFNECFQQRLGFSIDEHDLLWSKDHRPVRKASFFKYSWHIIVNIVRQEKLYLFRNICDEGLFFRHVMRRLQVAADNTNTLASVLIRLKQPDSSVYSSNRAFRLLHCSKYPNDSTTLEAQTNDHSQNICAADVDHFPLYHSTLGYSFNIIPDLKGKRRQDSTVELCGVSPKIIRVRPPLSLTEDTARNSAEVPSIQKFRLTEDDRQSPRLSGRKTLPKLRKRTPIIGIIRGFFRRCPREYDVVRYAEENGLQISQVKPWSEKYPDTFIYRFDPSPTKPCPNGQLHHSNGTAIIWKYVDIEGAVNVPTKAGLSTSSHRIGFGTLEHMCLDPECNNGSETLITKYYGDHYAISITPYWIPVDVIYRVITNNASITGAIAWLIRRLLSSTSAITKLIKTGRSWYMWNGLIWESIIDPADTISGFLEIYISSIKKNFIAGLEYWLPHNTGNSNYEEVKYFAKYCTIALEDLLRNIRNIGNVQSAITTIEVIFTQPHTLIDGPRSEGWLVIGSRYVDLKKGTFHAPMPHLYISQVVETPWRGAIDVADDLDRPLPKLELFLKELFGDRTGTDFEQFVKNLQMFLGYSLSGKGTLQTVAFMYGSGRNGKGLFCRLFKATIMEQNDNADHDIQAIIDPAEENRSKSNIRQYLQFQTIEQRLNNIKPSYREHHTYSNGYCNIVTNLDKKIICKNARSAENAHTAQLMGLLGSRCILFDELNAKEELDLAKFKQYTGGDAIVVRGAYNKETFTIHKPMFTFIITTNVLPGIAPEPSIVSRIKVIQFNIYFDPSMKEGDRETVYRKRANFSREDTVKSMEMKCEFLRWLLRGAYMFYQTNDINWCPAIINDTQSFWGESDIFLMFLEDTFEMFHDPKEICEGNLPCLIDNHFFVKVADFESMLSSYYTEKNTTGNQMIPLQRVYQRLKNEYNIFKLRTTRYGLQRAVYLFGLKVLIN